MKRLLLTLVLAAAPGIAAPQDSLLGITLVQNKGGDSLGVPMQIVLLLTLLTILPAILMSITPFLRITSHLDRLEELGRRVVWEGAQDVRFTDAGGEAVPPVRLVR